MPKTRIAALLFLVSFVAVAAPSPDSVVDLPAGAVIVAAGWCHDLCNQQCGGDCASAFSVGCTCYWVCSNGNDGESSCGDTLTKVSVCTE